MQDHSSYEVKEKIYESERTIVYRAIRKMDDLPVVLKILHKEFPSAEEIMRFKQEYNMLKELDSPSVIKVIGLETYGDNLCMVMEDCGGDSLAKQMRKNGMDVEAFLPIALQLSEIVGEIHRNGIIHKDINPGNILWIATKGQAKIIDFGIATRLASENAKMQNTSTLAGTLSYIAPEQTGRMNRSVDCRADFYSLGITYYMMLTGAVPFKASDPMELVHAHIARQPAPPADANPAIPEVVSNIVMKLMAKMAEDRYQTGFALQADLTRCLHEFRQHGVIEKFEIGQNDISEKLLIPEKLYGREAEIQQLLSSFAKVCDGTTELMLVTGYAGIGKSALVQELHKPITEKRGYFISGKFDPYKRNVPYLAFVQAFRELMQQIAGESEQQIAVWKKSILETLGANSQIIIDVIPEVEWIIGKQRPVAEIGPVEAVNRFNIVFQNFIRIFAGKDHPLALFVDDLQWADAASLKLIEIFTTDRDAAYMLFIGAYRDNEVDGFHPLAMTLDRLKKNGVRMSSLKLGPLDPGCVSRLLADTLHCEENTAKPLIEICLEKTKGNPFFLKQFLHSLCERNLLTVDSSMGIWTWKMDGISYGMHPIFVLRRFHLAGDKTRPSSPQTHQ